MKNSKLTVLAIVVMLFGFSACKSSELATDATSASDAMPIGNTDSAPTASVQAEPSASSSVNVADLVAKHIKARGGEDKINAVQTVKMTGNVEASGMNIEMTNYIKRPDKVRSHLVIKSMNMEINQGFDGTMGWMQYPGQDLQLMPKEMANSVKDQANIGGILMDYEENGITLEYLGEASVNESPAHKIKIVRPDQPEAVIYLDAASHMEVKIDGEGMNPQTGQSIETETFLSDFRLVDGIQMAHVIEVKMDGTTLQKIVLDKIEVNLEIDSEVFVMPGKSDNIK